MTTRAQPFEQLLLESIDEGLSVLGNEPCQALYQYLLTICSLPREEIPGRVSDFVAGLRKSLGGASKVIERIILRKLFQKTGSSFRETIDTEFTEYIADGAYPDARNSVWRHLSQTPIADEIDWKSIPPGMVLKTQQCVQVRHLKGYLSLTIF